MKRLFCGLALVVAWAWASVGPVSAQLLYFDNFNQFTNGTVFNSDTNYSPGAWAPLWMTGGVYTDAVSTVVASNLLGSVSLFVNAPANSGGDNAAYEGMLDNYNMPTNIQVSAYVTNDIVDVQWLSWIAATSSSSKTGGLAISVADTNLYPNCGGSGCTTNFDQNPLVIFADNGSVYAFTGSPNNGVGPLPLVPLGAWGAWKNTVMTNRLVLNYPARTFALFINGTTITNNMSISQYFTNIFTGVNFGFVEMLRSSGGNKFAIDNIQVLRPSTNADVVAYVPASKGQIFQQTDASTVTLATTGYVFSAEVHATSSNTLYFATLHDPNNNKPSLNQFDPSSRYWEFEADYTSSNALNAAYPSGAYRLNILGANQGHVTPTLNFTGDTYPNTPQITNWGGATNIDATADFTLQWASSGGGAGDTLFLEIDDMLGNVVVASPDVYSTNALTGVNTSYVIPANTLQAGTAYSGQLVYFRHVVVDTNTVPGAVGVTGYFKLLTFPLQTAVPPVPVTVALAQTAAVSTLTQGDTSHFTITAANNGTNDAAAVTITDPVPAGLAITNTAVSQGNVVTNGNDLTYNVGTLAAGNTATLTLYVTGISTGQFCNTATLHTSASNLSTATVATACLTVNPAYADLAITQTVSSATVAQGDNVTYTLTVANNGPNGASGVTVSDTIPANFSLVSVNTTSGTIGTNGNAVTATVGALGNAGTATITIVAQALLPGITSNTATVNSSTLDTNAANNTASAGVTINQTTADLSLTKVGDAATLPTGSNLTYTITVANNGPATAYGVVMNDTVPASAAIVSNRTTVGTVNPVGQAVTANIGTLLNGQSAVITLIVTPSVVGSLTNSATVTTTSSDTNAVNDTATCVTAVTVPPVADLALTLVSNVTTATLHDAFTYTLIVTNKGPADAVNAELTEPLPAGVAFGSASTTLGTVTNLAGIVTCDFDTLPAYGSATVSVVVTAETHSVICSTGTVASAYTDPVPADNTATVCVPVRINDLAITKFSAPQKVKLTNTKPQNVGKMSVALQNRGDHTETIRSLEEYTNLVTVALSALGTNVCSEPVIQVLPPRSVFPIAWPAGKNLQIAMTITFTCATDPLASTKTVNHADWQYQVTVHHEVLDGQPNSFGDDAVCPHNALGAYDPYNLKIKDKGCGVKQRDGTFAPLTTDITDTRTAP